MVATFCLRLAFGLIAPLILLDIQSIPPRFFRVQFLAALGLLGITVYFLHSKMFAWPMIILLANGLMCLAGSIIWHLDNAPGGKAVNWLTGASLAIALVLVEPPHSMHWSEWQRPADHYASAAVLGTAITAMLLGHSYLISPTMTIAPLQRMLMALAGALVLRITLACVGLWQWTTEHSLANLDRETLLWLLARWLLGILAPLTLGWMAWETTRIRSTQSATGILYVVVVVVFLGELTSLLLLEKTGSIL